MKFLVSVVDMCVPWTFFNIQYNLTNVDGVVIKAEPVSLTVGRMCALSHAYACAHMNTQCMHTHTYMYKHACICMSPHTHIHRQMGRSELSSLVSASVK